MKKPADSFFKTVLAVDTGARESISLGLIVDGEIADSQEFPVRSQELQKTIVDFLAENNVALSAVKALAVFRSGESLTGSRMGVAAVNTLAWLTNLPIIEIDEPDFAAGLKQLTGVKFPLSVVRQTTPLS